MCQIGMPLRSLWEWRGGYYWQESVFMISRSTTVA